MLESLYNVAHARIHDSDDRRNPLKALGEYHKPPKSFEHAKDTLVATIPADADGYPVNVYESRWPTRFYKVVAMENKNSGKLRPGFEITTGSGDDMGELAAQIALQLSRGMLGIRPLRKKKR